MYRNLRLLALAGLAGTAQIAGADVFRFVALPDTQIYSENIFPDKDRFPPVTDARGTGQIFGAQTQWVVDNAERLNIRYVGHLGDIIQDGSDPAKAPTQWALAKDAMNKLLDADIPHGTVMGNHDDQHTGPYNQDYLTNFGPQVFAGRDWYTGSSPSGGGNYQLLEHEGQNIGFINFSIDQPQSEIDWANDIIINNRDTLFVLGTHRYMYDYKLFAGRYDEVNVTPLGTFQINNDGPVPGVVNPNFGQQLYEKVVQANDNVLMIHSGHFHSEWLRVADPAAEVQEQAIELLTDYQDARNGGDGWLRLYSIDIDEGTFGWETYSPTLDETRSTLHHFVETIQQAYVQRDQVMALLGFGSDAEYLGWLDTTLKDNPLVPDGFLTMHPDWNAAYFDAYLSDMFNGEVPEGFENILEWENLWLAAFAADPSNPLDFGNGVRSPSGELLINYDAFVTAVPLPGAAWLFAAAIIGTGIVGRRSKQAA